MLDYLGQLVGVTRLAATGASCTLQFTLAASQPNPFTIPAGTLIGTQDGQFIFATNADLRFRREPGAAPCSRAASPQDPPRTIMRSDW
jgi:hypothetical protein